MLLHKVFFCNKLPTHIMCNLRIYWEGLKPPSTMSKDTLKSIAQQDSLMSMTSDVQKHFLSAITILLVELHRHLDGEACWQLDIT